MTDERVIQSDRTMIAPLCSGEFIQRAVMEAFLGFHVGTWDYATSCTTLACVAHATMVQQPSKDRCGWAGVRVAPMTKAFAESLGMAEPYGAIFDRPEPGSPAAAAGIQQGDVLTAINGSPPDAFERFREYHFRDGAGDGGL